MPQNQNQVSDGGLASGLSLAAKLYAIFGLFALLTAAITLLSDYNSRRAAELTESIQTANLAALNVERVNSLVYAVVMESRGVYMSTDKESAKKYGDGLLKLREVAFGVRSCIAIERDDRFLLRLRPQAFGADVAAHRRHDAGADGAQGHEQNDYRKERPDELQQSPAEGNEMEDLAHGKEA